MFHYCWQRVVASPVPRAIPDHKDLQVPREPRAFRACQALRANPDRKDHRDHRASRAIRVRRAIPAPQAFAPCRPMAR